jgi:hypothetical protein
VEPYYVDGSVRIYCGDCRDVLPKLNAIETCITDPPYEIGFMGKSWDRSGVAFDPVTWHLVAGALLPGASILAFGGTRSFHRLICAIEDAYLEIRDCLMWLYGSGFPKSLDISKAIDRQEGAEREVVGTAADVARDGARRNASRHGDTRQVTGFAGDVGHGWDRPITVPATESARTWAGWGTALKPAWEPIVLAMKPCDGTFADNALTYGVAGLNVDGARIGTTVETWPASRSYSRHDTLSPSKGTQPTGTAPSGRWPANLVLDEAAAAMLDEQSGERTSGSRSAGEYGRLGFQGWDRGPMPAIAGDSGGASRFFYTAKASRSDRGEGNDHPTVKPSYLMKWLVTLTATPTGGTILDPFMGSGTTLYAAKECGRRAVGIDLDERNCEIAARRCSQEVLAL